MSASSTPLRRVTPQTGAAAWTGANLSSSEIMLPLGAEHAAELAGAADAATPRLDALAAELDAQLDHGRGMVLLRGLPVSADPAALLRRLARTLGTPLPDDAGPGAPLADLLLFSLSAGAEVELISAAAVHNALFRADRAALALFYERGPDGVAPVFSVAGGVFAGRADPALLAADAGASALAAALGEPGLALSLSLRPGDVLALNPFLVWLRASRPGSLGGAARLALRAERSRAAAWSETGA